MGDQRAEPEGQRRRPQKYPQARVRPPTESLLILVLPLPGYRLSFFRKDLGITPTPGTARPGGLAVIYVPGYIAAPFTDRSARRVQ